MNINACYPSKLLKAVELTGPTAYTIKAVQVEELGTGKDKEHKPVVYFNETDRGLALNKTNANTISAAYGVDTDGWTGRPITLFPTDVEFQGRLTPGIRVRASSPQAAKATPAPSGTKAAAWSAFQSRINSYSQEPGATPYTETERADVFRKLMGATFPGKTGAQLTAAEWETAEQSFREEFDPATRAFAPF